jgi:hypothetical protein
MTRPLLWIPERFFAPGRFVFGAFSGLASIPPEELVVALWLTERSEDTSSAGVMAVTGFL